MRSKKLLRQLKRGFANENVESSIASAKPALGAMGDQDARAQLTVLVDGFPEFLTAVDSAYAQLEDRLAMAERSLELGSKELTDANSSLYRLNQTFDAMVNSLGQGFLIFGKDRICLPVYSKACEMLLECEPAGQPIAKVLAIPAEALDSFERWLDLMFREPIAFADLAEIGPKHYKNSKDLAVNLEYKPVRDSGGRIEFLVIVATDRTAEYRAKAEANKMQTFVQLASSILKDRESFVAYVGNARKLIADASILVENCASAEALDEKRLLLIRRLLHTLKGAAHSYGMLAVGDQAHAIESALDEDGDNSARLSRLKRGLPELMQSFEATLEEHRDILGDLFENPSETRQIALSKIEEFHALLVGLGPHASKVRKKFESEILSVPVRKIFRKYEDVVQQTATTLGKSVRPVEYNGGDLRIPPGLLSELLNSQCLGHLFRNMVDHGIEDAETRLARGKPKAGLIQVAFERFERDGSSHLRIAIMDDGGGIDLQKIRAAGPSALPGHTLQRIFEPGFSTASAVTTISGRGIGLYEVKSQIEAIGGRIWAETELQKWTRFIIELPERESESAQPLASNRRAAV